jgi:hypothetical protein
LTDGLVVGEVDKVQAFVHATHLDASLVIIDVGGVDADRLGVTFNPAVVTVRGRRLGHAAIVNNVDQVRALIDEERKSDGNELAARPLGSPRTLTREEVRT